MKKVLFVMVVIIAFAITSYAQVPDNSIRKIVRDYFVENIYHGEWHLRDNAPRNMTFWLSDAKKRGDKGDIVDYTLQLPISDTLLYYVARPIGSEECTYLMFARRGNYMIINMDKSLPNIMTQYVELCKLLKLKYKDELFVLKEITRYCQHNYDDAVRSGMLLFK